MTAIELGRAMLPARPSSDLLTRLGHSLMSWKLLLVGAIVTLSIAAVVGLTFAGKDSASVAYLLVAIIPSTIASILSVKKSTAVEAKIDTVVAQTNGPIASITEQVGAIHAEIVKPEGKS